MAITITDVYGNVIDEFTQWDSNRTIYIHGLDLAKPPAIHFSTQSSTKSYSAGSTLENDVIVTTVPNILLEQTETISIYVYSYNIDTREGQTVEIAKKPVRPKKKPDDYIYKENVTVVNVVALNNQVRDLSRIITTGGVLEDNIIQFTSDFNGIELDVFKVDLSGLLATDEEANEYLFGENENGTEIMSNVPFSTPPEKSSALKQLKSVFDYCLGKISDLCTKLTDLIAQTDNKLSNRILVTENNISELKSEDVKINSSIGKINSSIGTINSSIDSVKNSIKGINTSITTINNDISGVHNDISSVNNDIGNMHNSISTINGDITGINQSISDINNDITSKYDETTASISGINKRLGQAEETITLLSDITHPVNSIFISKNDTPLDFGTWKQLKTETITDKTESNEDITLYYWIRIK